MPDRPARAAGEAGGFNEEQKLLTAQGRIAIVLRRVMRDSRAR